MSQGSEFNAQVWETRGVIHLASHVAVPLLVALWFYRPGWRRAFIVMMAGMLIDVDHLLADPIYDPSRCSVGFHPLHTLVPIGVYLALFAHERTRLFGLGLMIHILLDMLDCRLTIGSWFT